MAKKAEQDSFSKEEAAARFKAALLGSRLAKTKGKTIKRKIKKKKANV